MTLKHKIHAHYQQMLQDRIDVFRDMIAALTEDSKNDAKGSAGDKHETALSMMHIEQEKLNRKLTEIYQQKAILDKIDPDSASSLAALGSMVVANGIYLYVCAALPKINVEGITVLALSPQSPLGMELMGKSAGSSFDFNGTHYTIGEIF